MIHKKLIMQGTLLRTTTYILIGFVSFITKGTATTLPAVISNQNDTSSNFWGGTVNQTGRRWRPPAAFVPFGSLHTLEKLAFWAFKEEEMYNVLQLRRKKIKEEIELIKKYIADYEATSEKAFVGTNVNLVTAADRGRFVGSSPVLAHRMTDRYAGVINELRVHVYSDDYRHVSQNVTQILEIEISPDTNELREDDWPELKDLFVSHIALLEIQNFYEIEADILSNGITLETEVGGTFNAFNCLLLGTVALKLSHYFQAIEWLEFTMAYIGTKNTSVDLFSPIDLVKRLIQVAIQEHNHQKSIWSPPDQSDPRFHQKYFNMMHFFAESAKFGERALDRDYLRTKFLVNDGQTYGNDSIELLNMFTVCMGMDLQPLYIKARLYCYLEKKKHPYFILNPLKTELLSEYPYIVQFYDVIGNDTIDELYRLRGDLHLSTVHGAENLEDNLAVRSSVGGSPDMELVYKIQNRSELLTGLLLNDFIEGIQTAEYVYGRFYKTHMDPISFPGIPVDINVDPTLEKGGDRIATLLYYIDGATEGGDTAFGQVGISTRSIRASAVFWLNMYRNGSVRPDTAHTACPVIHGFKTIINQWIRYNSNFQTFKCLLDPLQ